MGYGRGGYGGGGGYRGGRGGKFEPQPGSGTLFIKNDKRSQQAPDYDGYFIVDRDIRAGEKIKLVGWDKNGNSGQMITLKLGRERQDAPGYNDGGQQGYSHGGGYESDRGGYRGQNPGYQGRQTQGYGAPAAPAQRTPGAYQGGGYGGQPVQTYQPAQGQAPAQPPAASAAPAAGPAYSQPPPADDLPF